MTWTDRTNMVERCDLCGCRLHRGGSYAARSVLGRSHASKHHYVAERFFGRSKNRRGSQRERVFAKCPWGLEGEISVYCYDCHELLLHNPVFLPNDIERLREIILAHGYGERRKERGYKKLAGRIRLLHEVIDPGLTTVLRRSRRNRSRGRRGQES
jgi:hypothetical protein